jgi:hypothetical protein
MEVEDEPDAQLPGILLVEIVQCAGVAGELRLAPVSQYAWYARDELGDPGIVNDDPFDRARRGDGLDAGLFSQGIEELAQLVRVATLGAGGSVDLPQERNDVPGDGVEGLGVLEAPHRTS